FSLLYQPDINVSHSFSPDFKMAGQAMGNVLFRQIFRSGEDDFMQRGKLYRLWLKAGSPQLEARLGLQRLNFGSAQILRPLQWFDNLDPTDILERTEGVQAILVRKYFLNNANLWFWGIRGEGKTRGATLIATQEATPELGGRIQYPLAKGEAALTLNHRFKTQIMGMDTGSETRIGLDAKYDLEVGIWAEGYISIPEDYEFYYLVGDEFHPQVLKSKYQIPFTVGLDYTIGVGNGIYTMAEAQLWSEAESSLNKLSKEYLTFAVTANYPLGLLDTVYYFGTVRDDATVSTHTIIWRRLYDRWSFDASLFWDAGKLHKQYNSRGIKLVAAYVF
ncbi:MAG: hypothetical protein R6V77_01960, partial [Candidatus Cloacimonadaceae bacterium]